MKKHDVLFRILRAELWGEPLNLSEMPTDVYRGLMSMADMQTVTGLLGSALIEGNVKLQKMDAIDVYVQTQAIQSRNVQLNLAVAQLAQKLNDAHIRYVVIKGQPLALHYPHPDLRVPGDVDLFVHPNDMHLLSGVLEGQMGLQLPPFDEKRHVSIDFCETELEIHHRLTDFASMSHERYWNQLFSICFEETVCVDINGVDVKVLEPTCNFLFVFLHMYRHFMLLGCGLRQIMDCAVLLHSYQSQVSVSLLEESLRKLHLYDAFCAFGYIWVNRLGLPAEEFPFPIKPFHQAFEERILHEIFLRGNHGKYNRKVDNPGIMKSLETGWIYAQHCVRFYRLSPYNARLFPLHIWGLMKGE